MFHLWLYPLGPHVTSTSSNHFDILGRWSTSGSDRGIAHFFTATRNTMEGVGEKKRTTNNMLGLTQVQKGSYVTLFMCRLTLVWILQRNWTADSSWHVFTHCFGPHLIRLVSLLRCWLVSVVRRQLLSSSSPCPTLFSSSLTHFRSRRDLKSKTLCLVSRQNTQMNRLLGGPPA